MSKKNRGEQAPTMSAEEIGMGFDDEVVDESAQSDEVQGPSQAEQAAQRIADLEQQLKDAKSFNGVDATLKERIAHLEGKLQSEKSEEELFVERRQKYNRNVAVRKAKDAKKVQALADIEGED